MPTSRPRPSCIPEIKPWLSQVTRVAWQVETASHKLDKTHGKGSLDQGNALSSTGQVLQGRLVVLRDDQGQNSLPRGIWDAFYNVWQEKIVNVDFCTVQMFSGQKQESR